MLRAGFADEGAHVDEAGRDNVAFAINDPRLRGRGGRRDAGADQPLDVMLVDLASGATVNFTHDLTSGAIATATDPTFADGYAARLR